MLCLFVSFFVSLRKGELFLLLPVCFSPRPGCSQQEKTISIIYNIFFLFHKWHKRLLTVSDTVLPETLRIPCSLPELLPDAQHMAERI